MKTYKVVVRTEHVYTEQQLEDWFTHCTEHPHVQWTFSTDQRLRIAGGETVKVADDGQGRTFVQAKRIK